ncbi:LCP family protein [Halobacillus litoralis]|uniref:LCP family protein n=1 Tax=Halobacillus litoralis TaxID=45668 RepID=UPI001CD19527|nr:LCP family protein [Halobacillus litoralis]MCA0969596.1 LCP family protein [Halobacillus litoralis]
MVFGYSSYEYLAGKNQASSKSPGVAQAEEAPSIEEEKEQYKEDFQGVDNLDDKINVLLLGSDQRGDERARTDTIMIAQYDPNNQKVKLASIMRDTYTDIPGYGYNKINAAFYFGGPELLRQTISENFGVEIEYYSIVDFEGFTATVDTIAPKGIEVDVEKDMNYQDGAGTIDIDLDEGAQMLDGEELLGYARFRHDAEGDFGRVERQQKVIKLMKDELLSFNGVLKAPRLVGTVQPYLDTNLGTGKVLQIGKDLILNPVETIDTMRIPTSDNVWNERKDYPIGLVLNHDESKTKEELQAFFEDEKEDEE